ncbi:MAG: HAD-IC family P-type ATPase [Elusimicrobiota bacterium]
MDSDLKSKAWYKYPVKDIFSFLSTTQDGISDEEAQKRLAQFGPNQLTVKKQEGLFSIFIKQFQSPLIYILLFASIVSFLVGKTTNSFVILFVLTINAVMGFIQETRAKRTMESLKELSAPKTRVVRQGDIKEIDSKEVVPGDVLLLESGSKVTADGRLIESIRLKVNEASLTGESLSVHKITDPIKIDATIGDRLNMIFSGTIVVEGRGKVVVTATGMDTEIGKISEMIQSTPEPKTPFQRKMESFGKLLIVIVSIQVVAAFIIGYFVRNFGFYEIFLVALSQMVSSIPEGLPVAVTVALAVGMQRMAKRKALIRKLAAVEGLGSATYICSDKTGTLTKNEMTSRRVVTMSHRIEVTGTGYTPEGSFLINEEKTNPLDDKETNMLLNVSVLCNDAGFKNKTDISGDPTEIAYLVLASKAGMDLEKLKDTFPRTDEIPFEPHLQMMLTKHKKPDGGFLICVKGAPEKIIDICGYFPGDGGAKELTNPVKMELLRKSELMAKDSLRVLGFCYLEHGEDKKLEIDSVRNKLIFTGFIGNMDPPREGVKEAIRLCEKAGIKTIMVTGDHLATAESIAREIGILKEAEEGITGDLLNVMSDDELQGTVKNFSVFARIEPKNKQQIVMALQKQNEVVAMTGDGVNDAPALVAADIGIAMGITGTDVAKESSSMVIADDNFATIVNAVEEGRGITTNIRKTILYLLCSGNTEILVLLTALIAGLNIPLLAIQILWINLITDGCLTINLVMEPKENVMDRPPDKKNEPIVTKHLLRLLFFRAPIMAAGIIGMFVYEILKGQPLGYARTVAFTTLAFTQWINGINCRSEHISIFRMPFFSNRYLILGLIAAAMFQLMVLYVPFFQNIFETIPLKISDWLRIIAVGSTVFWAEELRKFIVHRKKL